jgi:hypothetical protein
LLGGPQSHGITSSVIPWFFSGTKRLNLRWLRGFTVSQPEDADPRLVPILHFADKRFYLKQLHVVRCAKMPACNRTSSVQSRLLRGCFGPVFARFCNEKRVFGGVLRGQADEEMLRGDAAQWRRSRRRARSSRFAPCDMPGGSRLRRCFSWVLCSSSNAIVRWRGIIFCKWRKWEAAVSQVSESRRTRYLWVVIPGPALPSWRVAAKVNKAPNGACREIWNGARTKLGKSGRLRAHDRLQALIRRRISIHLLLVPNAKSRVWRHHSAWQWQEIGVRISDRFVGLRVTNSILLSLPCLGGARCKIAFW